MSNNIGKKVIIRASRAGVFFGTLANKENTPAGCEVELTDCRRLWYWSGACSISQLALEGTKNPPGCNFSVTVPEITIIGAIEIIPCSDDAIKSIESVSVWKC